MALAVVHPEAGNIGGGGFMTIRIGDSVYTIDYREKAPTAASRDMYLNLRGDPSDLSAVGHLSVGVPGAVAGMAEAHRRFGKLTWARVMAPAIRLANQGFVIDDYRSRSLDGAWEQLYIFPASREYFFPTGRAPTPGTIFVQRDLGRTLQTIADSGAAGFYRGRVADLIVAEMQRGGGLITHEDLAAYKAEWREPVRLTYRGHTIYSMPPGLVRRGHHGDDLQHHGGVREASRLRITRAASPRGGGDAPGIHAPKQLTWAIPASCKMPLDRLLSKAYADSLRKQTDLARCQSHAAV